MEFDNPILGEEALVRNGIKSSNYVPDDSGWRIGKDGSAEFSDLKINFGSASGVIVAEGGEIKVFKGDPPELIIKLSPTGGFNDNGGVIAYAGPDSPDGTNFTVQLSKGVLMFSDELNQPLSPGNITWGNMTDSAVMYIDSGRRISGDNAAKIFLGSDLDPELSYVDLTCGQFKIGGRDQGRGLLKFLARDTSTTLSNAETAGLDTGLLAFYPNRAYRITLHAHGLANTANDYVGFRLRTNTLAGNSLMDTLRSNKVETANTHILFEGSQIVYNANVSVQYARILATVYRPVGTGNVQMFGNSFNNSWIEVRDIGHLNDYVGAKPI